MFRTGIRSTIERFSYDLEKWFRLVFVICFISQWMKRSKHGLFVFPPKKILIWTDIVGLAGQHSLTSVERPSNLRPDFVNVWRHARLVVLLRSSTLICLMIWRLFRGLVLLFRSSPDWFNQEVATAPVWKWCFYVSPRSSLLAHGEGPFGGCYWVTSLQWPRIEWHSRRITQTSK